MSVVVCQVDANLTACRRELKGVREDVDNDLVEVGTVNPHRQLGGIVLVGEGDALGLGLLGKQGVDVTDEGDELGLAHVHLHQSLINLTQVHHLVDKS